MVIVKSTFGFKIIKKVFFSCFEVNVIASQLPRYVLSAKTSLLIEIELNKQIFMFIIFCSSNIALIQRSTLSKSRFVGTNAYTTLNCYNTKFDLSVSYFLVNLIVLMEW